jgi:hypothetical protein
VDAAQKSFEQQAPEGMRAKWLRVMRRQPDGVSRKFTRVILFPTELKTGVFLANHLRIIANSDPATVHQQIRWLTTAQLSLARTVRRPVIFWQYASNRAQQESLAANASKFYS